MSDAAPPRPASPANALNADYIDEMYQRWQQAPDSLDREWQMFFQGFELSRECTDNETASRQSKVASLIYAYRDRGHRAAELDPLGQEQPDASELQLERFELSQADLEAQVDTGHVVGPQRTSLRELRELLEQTYCRSIGVEYLHIQDVEQRRWLQAQMEPVRNRPQLDRARRLGILKLLIDAELFETFLGSNYPGQKRFSLEGAETLIPAIHALVELCPELDLEEVVIGMPHRGRLNVLANILDKSYATIFGEFEDNVLPEQTGGGGDVKYHKGFSHDHVNADGRTVHLSLTGNPSHLEAVDPVVEGRTRAKQRRRGDTERRQKVVPLLLHGDAAFAGQGLVAETLNLSSLDGYRTGGTVHLIVNNQIGFTTSPGEARSTVYCTDVAKMIEAPIFHVNGDDPEAMVFATELALRYRQAFGRDVVLDMVCYRRHGHNEGDEPAFTQPLLYKAIKDHPSVRALYTERLLESRDLSPEMETRIRAAFKEELQHALDSVRSGQASPQGRPEVETIWSGLMQPFSHEPARTAVTAEALQQVASALCTVPDGFRLNRKVARQLPKRLEAIQQGGELDWGFAEGLAFGTLLAEGTPVRLSGQDSARGTFSHRHAVWQDMDSREKHTPANHIAPGQARLCVYNSMLSEAAVLGFDYGYSLVEPQMLILWEAQFGDFANGAQVIIDQFIVSAQAKWERYSGLVMLLPHGYEGQGPEHSNAYLERYLAACAEDNIQVCNFTTPAQLFHALRRQVKRPFRRPLVVMSPKSLLRHRRCVSPVSELTEGRFHEVVDDERQEAQGARRLVLCSGKLYYDLLEALEQREQAGAVALLRLEQLYPLHEELLSQLLSRYPQAEELVWAQEEPQNRGAWSFIHPHLERLSPVGPPRYVGRPPSASPATGSLTVHRQQQERLVQQALG